jgi:hypothetical protein
MRRRASAAELLSCTAIAGSRIIKQGLDDPTSIGLAQGIPELPFENLNSPAQSSNPTLVFHNLLDTQGNKHEISMIPTSPANARQPCIDLPPCRQTHLH